MPIIYGLLTAGLGWAGGRGKDFSPKWWFRSAVRDWGIAVLCAGAAFLSGVHSWWILLFIPATVGALSTYWDKVFKYDNFWFHGFVVGVASFPIAIATGQWWPWAIRCFILAVWMGGWSKIWSNAHVEESGRYFIVGATLPLLF